LRDQAWPHWGWSEARSGKHGDSRSTIQRSGKEQVPNGRMSVAISSWLVGGASLERGNWSLELLVRGYIVGASSKRQYSFTATLTK